MTGCFKNIPSCLDAGLGGWAADEAGLDMHGGAGGGAEGVVAAVQRRPHRVLPPLPGRRVEGSIAHKCNVLREPRRQATQQTLELFLHSVALYCSADLLIIIRKPLNLGCFLIFTSSVYLSDSLDALPVGVPLVAAVLPAVRPRVALQFQGFGHLQPEDAQLPGLGPSSYSVTRKAKDVGKKMFPIRIQYFQADAGIFHFVQHKLERSVCISLAFSKVSYFDDQAISSRIIKVVWYDFHLIFSQFPIYKEMYTFDSLADVCNIGIGEKFSQAC